MHFFLLNQQVFCTGNHEHNALTSLFLSTPESTLKGLLHDKAGEHNFYHYNYCLLTSIIFFLFWFYKKYPSTTIVPAIYYPGQKLWNSTCKGHHLEVCLFFFFLAVNKQITSKTFFFFNTRTFWLHKIIFFSKQIRGKSYGINQCWEKKIWNDPIILIPKTYPNKSWDMQISLQLKDSSCRPQQVVRQTWLKENMAPTKNFKLKLWEGL